ncbi:MAG: glycosyltransferase family A protein [Coriobacteriia bacterium]|nr:glycosyltransferase family A protein [Coriobacteriia bacterium]
MPRFSIVVPAYNAATTLPETLDAVLEQQLADWECVIVDDGSTDSTARIASEYMSQDKRFRVVRQENQGSAGAYNTGVSSTAGEMIVICSADDILLPNHLEHMARFIEEEAGYDIYSTNGYFWNPDGPREQVYSPEDRGSVISLRLEDVIRWCFYSVGATYRREWFDRVGGYRMGVFGEDYDFWMRAMALGARHRYLPSALSLHRKSEAQKSADVERAYLSDIRLVTDLRRDFKLSREEVIAVEECIATRQYLIAELHGEEPTPPPARYRGLRGAVVRLVGQDSYEKIAARFRKG